ncbi:MAG: ATPase [Candidatus Aenigmarchaeota archaeon ex4484_14]|nr:MAG: ATPase [Candidatus Aenigmarchaeota archaeon ex4484_14]
MVIKRIKLNVPGFDALVPVGVPESDLILLTGFAGTGKTVFGLHFLVASDEPGIFVSFEESLDQIRELAETFGWDLNKMEKEGKLRLVKYDPFRIEDILDIIQNNIKEIGAKRVVIDSIAALGMHLGHADEIRMVLQQINNLLRKNRCAGIVVSEIPNIRNGISRFGIEEFVTDGVILLHRVLKNGEFHRVLAILKMRATEHSRKLHPYEINKKGFLVHSDETFETDSI